MVKLAEDLAEGDLVEVNDHTYPLCHVTRSFDAVWAEVDMGGLELPVRFDYGHRVQLLERR